VAGPRIDVARERRTITTHKEEIVSAEITKRIIELLAQKAEVGVDEITPERTLLDIGLDSLHLTEIALWMKREYGVVVPEGELHDEQTVGEVLDYLTLQTVR